MTNTGDNRDHHHEHQEFAPDDAIDLRDLFARLMRGLPQIIGLTLLGLALAGSGYLIYSPFQSVSTSTRVAFSYPGFEKGEYPDRSKFQADDLRTPEIVMEAMKRCNLEGSTQLESEIRAALSVEGIIPPNIVKDRDRLRAAGQTPPVYVPDEYTVSLTLPRKFPLDRNQHQRLIGEIVSVYRENFRRTYANTPLQFGKAFSVLRNADYPDYEMVFAKEMETITTYLKQKSIEAKLFRSYTTNLTFGELLSQTDLFARIRLNETLGLINQNGFANDKKMALVKMNDILRNLNDEERRALDEESVVKDLLTEVQKRDQNYVLGVKAQAAQSRGSSPVLDQGVIDSLLANDSYSFMVRRVLEASLKVKQVQASKAELLVKIENMKASGKEKLSDQASVAADLQKSVTALEANYNELIDNIKKTHTDFSRQSFGDAIRISDAIMNTSMIKPVLMPSIVGAFLGFALGTGLSLLGIVIGRKPQPVAVEA